MQAVAAIGVTGGEQALLLLTHGLIQQAISDGHSAIESGVDGEISP